ncbi:hypothetical protein [Elioraea rosea]|nr:hypothetical protein [Elioraea rosea]
MPRLAAALFAAAIAIAAILVARGRHEVPTLLPASMTFIEHQAPFLIW